MPATYRKWVCAKPLAGGVLTVDNFALHEEPMPQLADGEALARVRLINVHSATRTRMSSGMTQIGATDGTNYACAEIVSSRDPAFREGDVIACQAGWQEYQIVRSADPAIGYGPITPAAREINGTNSQWTYCFRPALAAKWPPGVLMDVFGTSGMTAWFGMRECGPVEPGETVVVAGASGSVGALVVQIAREQGARIIGIAGGPEQCEWVKTALGALDCLDYRAADFDAQLARTCPDGVHIFSDGVGGALTLSVVPHLREHGRLFSYGSAASFYDDLVDRVKPTGDRPAASLRQAFGITPPIEALIEARKLKVACWIVDQFYHQRLEAEDALDQMLRAGQLHPVNTVVAGFENLPEAIVNLYRQPRRGKLQIAFVI